MKKVLLIAVFAIFGLGTVNAQGFSGGANIGLPVGDASNGSSISFGADVLYMFNADEDFTYGAASGFQYFLGKTVNGISLPNTSYLPIAGAARYALSDQFSAGLDLGLAFIMSGGSGSGLYYKPMVVYNLSDTMKLNAYYSGVNITGGSLSIVGAGIMFDF